MWLCLVVLTLLSPLCHAAEEMNPVAQAEAMVTTGNMRFTVLTSRMIRIEQSDSKRFEDRATLAIVNRNLPVPEFTTETQGGYLFIRTQDLTLRYLIGSTPRTSDKSAKNLCITFTMNGQEQMWFPGKDDSQNLMGTTRTLDRVIGDAHRGDLEQGILSRAGWAIIDESPKHQRGDGSTTFPLADNEEGFPWLAETGDKEATDWYFMGYGHDYKAALKDFTRVAGRVPMPPKYIFGYWYSRYWAYSQNDFIQLVTDMENNDIPVDVMIMDMDWHTSGWTGWTWNKNLIPNPTYLISYFHNHGLRTALNLHPADGVDNDEDGYGTIRSEMGYPTTFTDNIPWKLEDYKFYKSFFKNIMRVREKEGVDFWWLDWQQWLTSPYTEGLSETFWLNHVYYNDMKRNRTDRRPVIYHRWGGLGSHRYPIAFSGDTYATWSTLGYEIPFTSTASNVCYAYWGHDLGGHQGGNNDAELLQRWLQFGVFSPIFRTHATNDGRLERRIWKYKNFKQLRETVRLRYRMFPYLYTAARETYETGVGMCRPLYYEYPEEQKAYTCEDEYLFGNDMLVAPVYTPSTNGVSQRTTWLPEGLWWDVTHGKLLQGNYTHQASYTTDEIPLFYRAGSIIPNYPTRRTVAETPDTIVLYVVPGADGEGRFYEDDGDNQGYEEGACANTYFHQQWTPERVTLTIDARQGSFEGMPEERAWKVIFLGQDCEPSEVSSSIQNSKFEIQNGVLVVTLPKGGCDQTITVTVENGGEPLVVENESDPEGEPLVNEPEETVSGQLYICGTAVPNGLQRLEYCPNGTFKFHGTLYAGTLYIMNSDKQKATTKYCKPASPNADIVTKSTSYTLGYGVTNSEWNIGQTADNYRFTVDPNTLTLKGEQFTWWYEAWIVGGCTATGQRDGWSIEKGLAMEQNPKNPYEWTFVGLLRAYSGNVEANRLKINGQYDWNPKTLHPYSEDANLVTSHQVFSGNTQDYKWTIDKNGYYRIRINCFLETIDAEYLGETLPDGIEEVRERGSEGTEELNNSITSSLHHSTFDLSGRRVSNPNQKGVYIINGRKVIK